MNESLIKDFKSMFIRVELPVINWWSMTKYLQFFFCFFVYFEWCTKLWEHQAKLYITSFNFKGKETMQKKHKEHGNNILFKKTKWPFIFRSHICLFFCPLKWFKKLWCTKPNSTIPLSTLETKRQQKKVMKKTSVLNI